MLFNTAKNTYCPDACLFIWGHPTCTQIRPWRAYCMCTSTCTRQRYIDMRARTKSCSKGVNSTAVQSDECEYISGRGLPYVIILIIRFVVGKRNRRRRRRRRRKSHSRALAYFPRGKRFDARATPSPPSPFAEHTAVTRFANPIGGRRRVLHGRWQCRRKPVDRTDRRGNATIFGCATARAAQIEPLPRPDGWRAPEGETRGPSVRLFSIFIILLSRYSRFPVGRHLWPNVARVPRVNRPDAAMNLFVLYSSRR